MTSWVTRILDFISPRSCVVCGRRLSPNERSLCSVCLLHLPRTTYQFTPTDNLMDQLFWGQLPVERAAALMFYEPHSEMAQLVYQLKYGQRPDIGEDMGRLMAREMSLGDFFNGIDALVPVPLTRKRHRQRGYNQSEMLARGISHVTGIPVITEAVCREHFQQSQTSLNRRERQENVEGVFVLRHPQLLEGKHILLIDDICTTGATLMACGKVLQNIERVSISMLTLGFTKK